MNALDILTEESQKKSVERQNRILKGQQVPASVEHK
jgi:hypothetical protein